MWKKIHEIKVLLGFFVSKILRPFHNCLFAKDFAVVVLLPGAVALCPQKSFGEVSNG